MSADAPSTAWHRSEPRTVRPFAAARALSHALDRTEIRLRPDDEFVGQESLRIAADEAGRLVPTVRVALDASAIAALPAVERADLRCSVVVEGGFVKRTEVVRVLEPQASFPIDVPLPPSLCQEVGLGRSTTVSVVLALARGSERRLGKPFRKGHWLAKKSFAIQVEQAAASVSIMPLDDETLARLKLPAGTLYFVQLIGSLNVPPEEASDEPPARVWIAKEVIDRLGAPQNRVGGAPIEAFLEAEIAATLIVAGFAGLSDGETVVATSPLGNLVRDLHDAHGLTEDRVRELARSEGGARLRAYLHASSRTVRTILGR